MRSHGCILKGNTPYQSTAQKQMNDKMSATVTAQASTNENEVPPVGRLIPPMGRKVSQLRRWEEWIPPMGRADSIEGKNYCDL